MAYHHDLARMAVACGLDAIGSDTRKALDITVLDTLGCMAASSPEAFADASLRAQQVNTGDGVCSVVGRAERLTPAGAAFMNATLGHGYDFDDVHLPSVAHFSTIVIPAAMAACELFDADGRTFLEAVMAGDEVGGRIGWAACSTEWNGTAVRNRGFFPTAILGTIAAAAAAAKVARLDEERFAQAIAIACSYAGGLASVSRGDNSTKRTQAGWAAQAGLAAALLAKEGFTGPDSVLETGQGFFEAFTGNTYRPEALRRQADTPWVCEEMSFKWYPLEYIIHPLVEMADRARAGIGERLGAVTRIEASATGRFVTLFTPKATKIAPADPFMALMSAPYCIARALLKPGTGHLFLPDFRENYVCDDATRALASKVEFTTDPSFEAVFPQHVAGALKFFAGDELLWQDRVDDAYGSLHRPMSLAHLTEKFETNCAHLGPDYAAAALETLRDLHRQPDARWVGRLRRAPQ